MITLTDEQEKLIQEVIKWYNDPTADNTFEYSGPAGTGKSLVMHLIVDALGLKEDEIAPMAYTGAAALIMRRNGFIGAKTIHSSIYQSKTNINHKTNQTYVTWEWKGVNESVKLILVDEAGMVSSQLKLDIDSCNVKVLACGDLDQLPPVNSSPAYFTNPNNIFRLTKIMRQSEGNAIIEISQMLKRGEKIRYGSYGQVEVIYKKHFNEKRSFFQEM